MKDKDVRSAITQFARDEAGRFAKQEYIPKKKEPIFYGDLRESIGLKRNGDYIPSPGMTVRSISSKSQAPTGVPKELEPLAQEAKKYKTPDEFLQAMWNRVNIEKKPLPGNLDVRQFAEKMKPLSTNTKDM